MYNEHSYDGFIRPGVVGRVSDEGYNVSDEHDRDGL